MENNFLINRYFLRKAKYVIRKKSKILQVTVSEFIINEL
jgi:hypothetical protein